MNRFSYCVLSLMMTAANAQTSSTIDFAIAAQPLSTALIELSQQANIQVLTAGYTVEGIDSRNVAGKLTVDDALSTMLKDSGFTYRFVDEKTLILVRETKSMSRVGEAGTSGSESSQGMRLAQSEETQNREVDAGAVDDQSADSRLDEIVVTATKRSQNVEDVPISIAVIGGQDIERRGLVGMEDYLRSIPGVNQIDRGASDNAIVIRGISVSQEAEYFSAGTTVATYFDETPITGAAGGIGVDVRPVDMERIEVLRGPQGTAYGSSSLGGTVRLISAKPKLDGFAAKVSGSYSDTAGNGSENSMIQAVFNIPVAETLALRAVGYRYDESGFFRNTAGLDPATLALGASQGLPAFAVGHTEDDIGRIVSEGARLAALWKPTDQLDVSLTYLTQTIEQNGAPLATSGEFEQTRFPIDPRGRMRGRAGETGETSMDLAGLVVDYDLGWAALTSAASWIDGSTFSSIDLARVIGIVSSDVSPRDSNSFTAEMRLASQLDGRFQFLAGLFYEKFDWDFLEIAYWPGGTSVPPPLNPASRQTDPLFVSDRERHLDQRAVFGEISYELSEKLTATAGGRFFRYDKSERSLREGGLLNIPFGTGVTQTLDNSESDSIFKGNLSYEPSNNSLLYASWSQGFRLGRPDPGLAFCDGDGDGVVDGTDLLVSSTQSIASDFLENSEIGAKFSLFDRRMVIDASIYHIEWDGVPVRALLPPGSSCVVAYTANAGAATSDGVELQASLSVTEGLRLDFGGSYNKAQLAEDATALAPPAFDGDRLPGSPEINANFAAQYDFALLGHKAFVRADSVYSGEFYGDFKETTALKSGGYVKLDARAGVTIKNLNIELFVRNLTDEDAYTWRGAGGALSSATNPFYGYRLRPRTIGIQLGYSFE